MLESKILHKFLSDFHDSNFNFVKPLTTESTGEYYYRIYTIERFEYAEVEITK